MAIDPVTITATIAAVSAGVDLVDKIYGKVVHVLTGTKEPPTPPEDRGLQKLETKPDSIEFSDHGTLRTITGAELANLPPDELRTVQMYESAMETKASIFEAVYPTLELEADAYRRAQIELRLKNLIRDMSGDLVGVLDFLQLCGIYFDDHYARFRHLVAQHGGLSE
jgi:hypothetical protein